MTTNEMSYVAAFLEELSNHYGNDGSNDMFLPDSLENRWLAHEAGKYCHGHETPIQQLSDGRILVNNVQIVSYLKHKIVEEGNVQELPKL